MTVRYRSGVRRGVIAASLVLVGCVEIDPAFYDDPLVSTSDPGTTSTTTDDPGSTASTEGETSSSNGSSSGGGVPAAFCDGVDDAVVFCADFEDGDFEQWNDLDGNGFETNELVPGDGPRNATDNHVTRLRIPPGEATVDLVKQLPGYYDQLYMRWYIQYETGYDLGRPGLGSGMHAGGAGTLGVSDQQPLGDDRFSVLTSHTAEDPQVRALLDYRGMYQYCDDPLQNCYRDTLPCVGSESVCTNDSHTQYAEQPPLQTGQWYCVELMVDAGSVPQPGQEDQHEPDGVVSLSLDGEQIGRWDDLLLRTDSNLKLSIVWLLLYYGGDHGDEGVLLDDVVVSREPVGCW